MPPPYTFSTHIGAPPHERHERRRLIYMSFFLMEGWHVQFLESDLKTALPSNLTFADPERIRELARQGAAMGTPESRRMLEHAIHTGHGGVYLRLAPGKYWMLRQPGGL
jgi:hypothetical protein